MANNLTLTSVVFEHRTELIFALKDPFNFNKCCI